MAGGPIFTLVCALLWWMRWFVSRFECIAREGQILRFWPVARMTAWGGKGEGAHLNSEMWGTRHSLFAEAQSELPSSHPWLGGNFSQIGQCNFLRLFVELRQIPVIDKIPTFFLHPFREHWLLELSVQ